MLPQLAVKTDNITMQNTFLGVNLNLQPSEQEFADARNMTNDYYPVLGNRKKYNKGTALIDCKTLVGGEYAAYISKKNGAYKLFYGEQEICDVSGDDRSQIVFMGAYICVFPDGIVYNTADGSAPKTIRNLVKSDDTKFVLSKIDGTELGSSNTVSQATAPSDKAKYWIDTSQKTAVIKMYSESLSMWTSVGTTYVKIMSENPEMEKFEKYDAVTLSGVNEQRKWTYNNYDFNTSLCIYDKGKEVVDGKTWYYIVVTGLINKQYEQNDGAILFERKMPDIDFVCEQGNRLWACSSKNHEIYACAQGNPCNWYRYMGLDDDSYAATVGTQGDFTGAVSYRGYVYFFKEDGYHQVYGTKPSNYEMVWKPTKGVQKGSEKSIATSGDYLFYKAKDGVVMFDGAANIISGNLGIDRYFEAIGGTYRNKYYISMRDANYNYNLFVYDSSKGTWHIDNVGRCQAMAETTKNGLYIVKYRDSEYKSELILVNDEALYTTIFPLRTDIEDKYKLSPYQCEILAECLAHPLSLGEELDAFYEGLAAKYDVTVSELKDYIKSRNWYPSDTFYPGYTQSDISREENMNWSFETADMGMASPFAKYIKRIYLRMWLDVNTTIKVSIMYDSSDDWEQMYEYRCTRKRSYEVPLAIQRCDHFRLKFEGTGDMRLYSIAKAMEGGSGDGNI